jgi:hypothetical protein
LFRAAITEQAKLRCGVVSVQQRGVTEAHRDVVTVREDAPRETFSKKICDNVL